MKSGPCTDIGSWVSLLSTAREQVASNPIPLMFSGATPDSLTILFVQSHMADQISSVDCS